VFDVRPRWEGSEKPLFYRIRASNACNCTADRQSKERTLLWSQAGERTGTSRPSPL